MIALNRNQEAIAKLKRALAISTRVFGDHHTYTAIVHNNLGRACQQLQKHKKAARYHSSALAIRKRVFGEEHAETEESHTNLAVNLSYCGKLKESLSHFDRACAIREKMLGVHPSLASSLYDMAFVLFAMGNIEASLEHHKKAL